MKVTPAPTGVSQKHVVNLYSYEAEHFGLQSIKIKQLFHQYHCRIAVIDANGLKTSSFKIPLIAGNP